MEIITLIYNKITLLKNQDNFQENNLLIQNLGKSLLPKENGVEGCEIVATHLKQFIKFVYFEQDKFFPIPLSDFENFTEELIPKESGEGGGLDGMMGQLLSGLMGGGGAQESGDP